MRMEHMAAGFPKGRRTTWQHCFFDTNSEKYAIMSSVVIPQEDW